MTDVLAALMAGYEPADMLGYSEPPWMADALCREPQGVNFFATSPNRIEAAKKVCSACLVRSECLAYALEYGVLGVWGGTSEAERKRLGQRAA